MSCIFEKIYTKLKRKFRGWIKYPAEKKENGDKRKSFGSLNPDKVFYILRCDDKHWGMFTMCFDFMLQFEWAHEKGYIPVVDLKNYRPALLEDGNREANLWEKSFLQTGGEISLDEVYQSKNVILGGKNGWVYRLIKDAPDWNSISAVSRESVLHWGRVFNKNIRLNQELTKEVNMFYEKNFKHKKILGVAVREGYRYMTLTSEKTVLENHPILMTPEDSITLTKSYMDKWGYSYIFVICDDKECALKFKQNFGDNCIEYNRPRSNFFQNGKPVLDKKQVHSEYGSFSQRNKDYLIEVELLARCDAILSGITSGTEAALFRNNGKYEHVKIYDRGVYHF